MTIFPPPQMPSGPVKPLPSKPLPRALFVRWRALRPLLLLNAAYGVAIAGGAVIVGRDLLNRIGLRVTDTWTALAVILTLIFIATVALTPAVHLFRYAEVIYRAATAPTEEALEAVLRRQMRLWRAVAILAAVVLMLAAAAALRQLWGT